MTVSFEIARADSDDRPPFSDGCEGCLKAGIDFDGTVVPYATVTYGDGLVAFYHHARCGSQWFTSWSAQYAHSWKRIGPDGFELPSQRASRRAPRPLPREIGPAA